MEYAGACGSDPSLIPITATVRAPRTIAARSSSFSTGMVTGSYAAPGRAASVVLPFPTKGGPRHGQGRDARRIRYPGAPRAISRGHPPDARVGAGGKAPFQP